MCMGRLEKPETGIRNRNREWEQEPEPEPETATEQEQQCEGDRYKNRDIIYFKLF